MGRRKKETRWSGISTKPLQTNAMVWGEWEDWCLGTDRRGRGEGGRRDDTYPRGHITAGIIGYRWPPRCGPRMRALDASADSRDGHGDRDEMWWVCRAWSQGIQSTWGRSVGRWCGSWMAPCRDRQGTSGTYFSARPTRAAAGVALNFGRRRFDRNKKT